MRTARPTLLERLVGAGLAGVLIVALSACGSDDDEGADDATASETEGAESGGGDTSGEGTTPGGDIAPVQVAIVSVADGFAPGSVTVPVGAEVVWTNIDGIPHTSTATDGEWDSGDLGVSGTFTFTASEPGSYPYFCSIHPSMVGDIIVE